jgi:hypothetical protein
LVAAIVLFMNFDAVQQRIDSAGGLTLHGDGRQVYWGVAEVIFHQHFLWGAGPGHYKFLYALYAPDYAQVSPQTAHNDYLNTLCEWGLAGFGLIILTLGLVYGGAFATWPNVRRKTNEIGRKNSSKAAFVLGASLGLLSILIHSAVDFNMQIPANACVAVTLMALLTGHWRFATERHWMNPRKVGRVVLAVTALAAAGYLTMNGVRAGKEFYWQMRGMTEKVSWDTEIADWKKAYEIEPHNYLTQYELGETYRLRAWEGDPGNEALARAAMTWFEGAIIANPYDSWSMLGYGMCLDWVDRPQEATKYFVQALELRPNNPTIYLNLGRHCMELGNYPLAARWFVVASELHPPSNLAGEYLKLAQERMAAAKANQVP